MDEKKARDKGDNPGHPAAPRGPCDRRRYPFLQDRDLISPDSSQHVLNIDTVVHSTYISRPDTREKKTIK
jgi:hypothetical protein